MKLDSLAAAARSSTPEWSAPRSRRVLDEMLARRDRRETRARLVRRAVVGASGACAILLILLRGASAPAASSVAPETSPGTSLLAESTAYPGLDGDGGYARD